ncbi:uncharacterized protein LOC131997053 [Stomoxys calcitrans]|uniref:uncharacterized protein LOC131997053 n=1 Tax=Stomoxys calcitrans TaxID=35570 RepID=UPI0027E27A9D|nr:uncharacterized protein LOC131997053 [Stomoxys calcitrans]
MQIYFGIVIFLLSCLWCAIFVLELGVVVAQQVVGPNRDACASNQPCNRTSIDVCATNGPSCKRFSSNCELQAENCNLTSATAWNLTHGVQCSQIRINETGTCACSADGLSRCSNEAVTPGICTHRGVDLRQQECRLFRTDCDLRRASCNNQEWWLSVDTRQCRGFALNQTNPCHCPNLLQCSAENRTQRCVQVDRSVCRLYANECELESSRCDDERLKDVNILHCLNFTVNRNADCHCSGLLNCQRNNTNVCVRNSQSSCLLMSNECDVEQRKCEGYDLTVVSPVQCQNFTTGDSRNCSCPNLFNCSHNTTAPSICAKMSNGCKLLRNQCELEQERCQQAAVEVVSPLMCRGFEYDQIRNCSCPALQTCERSNSSSSNICIRTSDGCKILRNDCELEELRCQGEIVTLLPQAQCRLLRAGESGDCACPNWLSCSTRTSQVCTANGEVCRLLRNQCEMEQMKCQGEAFDMADILHCPNFSVGQSRPCFCPAFRTCNRNSSLSACVRGPSGSCRLLANACDLELAKCNGEDLTSVPEFQCRNFTIGTTQPCNCPTLFNCSLTAGAPRICARMSNGCKLLRNQCEMDQETCQGNVRENVTLLQCRGFEFGQLRNCSCPNLLSCSRTQRSICVRSGDGCAILRNECELEEMKCSGEVVTLLPEIQCKSLTLGQTGSCACPSWLSCSSSASLACIETQGGCRLLRNQCELERMKCHGEAFNATEILRCRGLEVGQETKPCYCMGLQTCGNSTANICASGPRGCTLFGNRCDLEVAKCGGTDLKEVSLLQCKNFAVNDTRPCSCPNYLNCNATTTSVCVKIANSCKLLRNQCEVEEEKCRGTTLETISHLHCRDLEYGQLKNCSCPSLETCSTSRKNICVRNFDGCKLLKNECELEKLRCIWKDVTILPDIQCRSLSSGETGACACPSWLSCARNQSQVCIETERGCQLLGNHCELEAMKCRGTALNVTHATQCRDFEVGQVKPCSCPELPTCGLNNITNVCAKGPNGCKLMATNCDLVMAKCRGESWQTQNSIQCTDIPVNHTGSCFCPALETCDLMGSSSICVTHRGKCTRLHNRCDLEMSWCKGKVFGITASQKCLGIPAGVTATCSCPELDQCDRKHRVCGQNGDTCRLFANDCQRKAFRCQDEKWEETSLQNCCQFRLNEQGKCSLLSENKICGRATDNTCRIFDNRCQLNSVNNNLQSRYSMVDLSQCKCLTTGRPNKCVQRPVCSQEQIDDSRNICALHEDEYRWFTSGCHMEHFNFWTCKNFWPVREEFCANIRNNGVKYF